MKKRPWLATSTGLNVTAIGMVASIFSIGFLTFQDIWVLLTGDFAAWHGVRSLHVVVYLVYAAVALCLPLLQYSFGGP